VGADVAPTVQLYCGPVAKGVIARQPAPPAASINILSDAEEAELRAVQDRFRDRLRATHRESFLSNVDTPAFPLIVDELLSDVGFDPHDVERLRYLVTKSQRSAAVFVLPTAPGGSP
jgi:hypothetical protein